MMKNVEKLELLCIEETGKYINIYSKIDGNLNNFRFSSLIGEKIINSYISNSIDHDVNENGLKFILNHSFIRKINLCKKIFRFITNLKFLNNRQLDKLTISPSNDFKIDDDNFHLKVKKLKILNFCDITKSDCSRMLSNCVVEDSLIIIGRGFRGTKDDETRDNILRLIIENSSKNLNTLKIISVIGSNNFPEKLMMSIKQRKNIRNVRLEFPYLSKTTIIRDILLPSSKSIIELDLFNVSDWFFDEGNILFKLLTSLKILKFSFPFSDLMDFEIEDALEFLHILKVNHSKNLIKLKLKFDEMIKFKQSLKKFLKNCNCLNELYLVNSSSTNVESINIFDSLISTVETLKSFKLHYYYIKTKEHVESIKNLFSACVFTEIFIDYTNFTTETFKQFLIGLENSRLHLSSLSVVYCNLGSNGLEEINKFIGKCTNLNNFLIRHKRVPKSIFNRFCTNLMSSCEKLEKIQIDFDLELFDDGSKLVKLVENCKKLKSISINSYYIEINIPDLLNSLKDIQENLIEIDLIFFFKSDDVLYFSEFLSKCKNLKRLTTQNIELTTEESEKFIESLKNCKYSLKYLDSFTLKNFHSNNFPNLMS